MTPPTIVPLSAASVADAARLVADLRTSMNGRVVCTPQDLVPVLARALDTPTYHAALALLDGAPVGYIGWNDRFAIYAGGPFSQITELFVDPSARRQGVAAALLAHAQHQARQAGAGSVEISIPSPSTHPDTLAFYQAQGYALGGPKVSKTL